MHLALQVTQDEPTYYGKAAAIEEYLQTNYLYSLKPGIAEDGNQLHHFLFVSKKGYCSYFAFAMALMCRSLGIPARVAVGFYVDPQSEVLNFYEVRAFQAHAWVEVYFGDLGWVEFDPTSSTPAPGRGFRAVPRAGPGPDGEADRGDPHQPDRPGGAGRARPALAGTASRLGREIARIVILVARLWYITLPALYALLLLGAKLAPSLPGLLSRDPRRRAKASYRLGLVRLAGVGLSRRTAESPLEHAARVCAARGHRPGSFRGRVPQGILRRAASARTTWPRRGRPVASLVRSFRASVPWPRRSSGL